MSKFLIKISTLGIIGVILNLGNAHAGAKETGGVCQKIKEACFAKHGASKEKMKECWRGLKKNGSYEGVNITKEEVSECKAKRRIARMKKDANAPGGLGKRRK